MRVFLLVSFLVVGVGSRLPELQVPGPRRQSPAKAAWRKEGVPHLDVVPVLEQNMAYGCRGGEIGREEKHGVGA